MSALRTDYLPKDMDVIIAAPPAAQTATTTTGDLSLHLTPGELSEIVSEIKEVKFSPYLQHWIKSYETVGQRGRFLWQWCLKGVRLTTLPSVDPELREHVVETKMLGIFFCTLIDDIADREQDGEMLQMAIGASTENWAIERLELWNGRRRAYLEMISGLWNEIWS